MPEYTEVVAQATTSTRAYAAHVYFPRGQPTGQTVVFEEEEVTVIGTKVSKHVSGSLSGALTPLNTTFPVINPNTGVPTGATATHLQLVTLLASLYADLVAKRTASGG